MTGLFTRFRKGISAIGGIVIRPDVSTSEGSSPAITVGAGAPSATDPNGSAFHRTDGPMAYMQASAWRTVATRASSNIAASTAVSNTVSETAFSTSYALPANGVVAGSVIRIRYQGIATATNSTDTLTIKCKLGSTALVTTAAVDVADNNIFDGEVYVVVRTVGASGTYVACGSYADPGAAGTARKNAFTASTAIDTTASNTIAVSATWSVASASNSCRLDVLTVEVL